MQSLVRWCLDRRPVVLLVTVLILVGGAVGATQLRQQLFPDFDLPISIVTIEASDLDATATDELVAQPVERAVKAVEGVASVTTVATEGRLRLYVELDYGFDSDELERSITDRIADLDLPESVEAPKLSGGFQEQAVVLATIRADGGDLAATTRSAEQLRADIEAVDGVARVELAGGSDPRVQVTLTPRAAASGITAPMVAEVIEAADAHASAGVVAGPQGMPVGVSVEGPKLRDAVDYRALRVGEVTLGEVADVREVDAADAGFASVNGAPALTLSVFRETGKDEVEAVDGVLEVLDDAERRLEGDAVAVLFESASEIRASIKGLLVEASLGAIFAVLVIFLFLRSARGTLVAAISIPTSIVFGVFTAWMLGLTINIITLAGLTIAVGRVIDDGIVVLENIHKHLERGASRRDAMVDGTSEVAVAIASSTIATAAVFLPIGLVGGLISEIFLSFSIIVTMALLASLLVAVTLIPVVGSFVLRPAAAPHDPDAGPLARMVEPATTFGIRWRLPVLAAAVVSMLLVFVAVGRGAIPVQFLPDSGTNQIRGAVNLPPGTSVEAARKLLAPLDRRINAIDGLQDVQVTYGIPSGDAAFDPSIGASTAEFFFTVDESVDGARLERQLRSFGTKRYPSGFNVAQRTDGPPSGTFQVNIEGDTQASIAKAAELVERRLRSGADEWKLVEIEAQAARQTPQLEVRARPGAPITAEAIADSLEGVTAPLQLTTSTAEVSIGSLAGVRTSVRDVGRLPVVTTDGATVPLASVATVEQVEKPVVLNRVDGRLSGSITARMLGEDTRGTTAEIRSAVEDLKLPEGVSFDWNQGDAEFISEMFQDMAIAMLVAIALVFLVLVLFFGSLAHPFTILAPILFSFIGSFGALIVTQRALGLPAMIGQLLLIGIIVSNSILLVDATLQRRRQGSSRDEALVEAARLRVRPVLMTAAATIAALLPLALGVSGEGGIVSQSLGTVVIGGLLVATLLTLVIVPAVFRILDRDRRASRRTQAN